jgi:peptide deformylase
LIDTLDKSDGVGVAAPQIGVLLQVSIIILGLKPSEEPAEEEETEILPLIDPVIIEEGEWERSYDGCLSVPGLQGYTYRPNTLRIQGLDLDNNLVEYFLEGFDARIAHHEIDHLNGILYFDRMTSLEELSYLIEDPEDPEKIKFLPYLDIHPELNLTPNKRIGLPTRGVKTIAN